MSNIRRRLDKLEAGKTDVQLLTDDELDELIENINRRWMAGENFTGQDQEMALMYMTDEHGNRRPLERAPGMEEMRRRAQERAAAKAATTERKDIDQ